MKRIVHIIRKLLYTLPYFMYYYCTLCGRWCQPYRHLFNVEEKACEACLYKAKRGEI